MSRMPERRPSIIVSDQVSPSPVPTSCRVLPLPRRPVEQFDDVDAQFFHDGDQLGESGSSDGWTEWQPERSASGRLRRGLRWSIPVAALALGGALAARHLDRAQAVAAVVEVRGSAEPAAPTPPPAASAPALSPPLAQPVPAPSVAAPAATPLPGPAPAPPTAELAVPESTAEATDRLADCKAAHGKHRRREALAACAEAAAQHPEVAEVAAILAQHEFERGRAQPALTWARKAIALDERHADAYVFLGGAEQALGRGAAAKTAYLRYLELAPRGRYAADLRAVLASLR